MLTKAKVRRLKFWWHLAVAYILRYKVKIVTAALLAIMIAFFFAKIWPIVSRSNVVTIGYVGSHSIENIPAEALTLATKTLISIDPTGRPIPSLASHWTVSEDGKTYIVYLKDNLLWHDGTQVDAQNIAIAISNVEVSAINNKTLEFRLPNPIASFPQALNRPIFKAESFYGTGDFRIVKIDQIENSVKKIVLHPKDSSLPRVEIKFYPTEEQLTYAIKIGEVKYASVTQAQDLASWPTLSVAKEVDYSQLVTMFLNNEDGLLKSKDVRQALIYTVDRTVLLGETADSPIAPTSWAYNPSVKKYEYSVAKAKELINKSGQKDLKITLSVMPGMEDLALKIKEAWQAVGINVELRHEKALPEEFQALLAVNELTPDPDQYALWHSTQDKTNLTHYKNVRIDKLLEDARSTNNDEARKELYADFQRFIVEDLPAIFLYHPHHYKVTYKNVEHLISKLPQT